MSIWIGVRSTVTILVQTVILSQDEGIVSGTTSGLSVDEVVALGAVLWGEEDEVEGGEEKLEEGEEDLSTEGSLTGSLPLLALLSLSENLLHWWVI